MNSCTPCSNIKFWVYYFINITLHFQLMNFDTNINALLCLLFYAFIQLL